MIVHQAVGVHLPSRFQTTGSERLKESVPIYVVAESARITFLEDFSPGFWEERVGDPKGNIPWDVLERFGKQAEAWRRRRR